MRKYLTIAGVFCSIYSFGQTQPTQANVLEPTGAVGIGTMSPDAELDVNGDTKLRGEVYAERPTYFKDCVIIDKDVHVKDKMTIDSRLNVQDKAVFQDVLRAKSKLRVDGNAVLNGNLKIKSMEDPSATEERFLYVNQNGLTKSLTKSGLIGEFLAPATCFVDANGNYPAPKWSSIQGLSGQPGVVYTNVDCPSKVGIGINNPVETFELEGTARISGNTGIGITPSQNVQLFVAGNQTASIALCADMPASAGQYTYAIKARVGDDNTKGLAVSREDTGEDVFRAWGDGRVEAKSMRLSLDIWSDYVFEEDYDLMPLSEVKSFINQNHHLPNVPSEQEMKESGLNVAEVDAKLLEKIEELTLYIIELEERLEKVESK